MGGAAFSRKSRQNTLQTRRKEVRLMDLGKIFGSKWEKCTMVRLMIATLGGSRSEITRVKSPGLLKGGRFGWGGVPGKKKHAKTRMRHVPETVSGDRGGPGGGCACNIVTSKKRNQKRNYGKLQRKRRKNRGSRTWSLPDGGGGFS